MLAPGNGPQPKAGRSLGADLLSAFRSGEATGAEIYLAIRASIPQAGAPECSTMVARWEKFGYIRSIDRPCTRAGAAVTHRAYEITDAGRRFFAKM